jgi:hypothetical protein
MGRVRLQMMSSMSFCRSWIEARSLIVSREVSPGAAVQRFTPALLTRLKDSFRVRLLLPSAPRDLVLRYAKGSAPAPVAHTARQGNPNASSELTLG